MPIRPEMKDRYPADWDLRSRFVRFVRAKGRCEWCGAVHGRFHPVTGSIVVLTCAHVFDHRPEAANLLNLAALCQRCHLGHDAPGKRYRRHAKRDANQLFLFNVAASKNRTWCFDDLLMFLDRKRAFKMMTVDEIKALREEPIGPVTMADEYEAGPAYNPSNRQEE